MNSRQQRFKAKQKDSNKNVCYKCYGITNFIIKTQGADTKINNIYKPSETGDVLCDSCQETQTYIEEVQAQYRGL